jgi:hypothetical protein
MHDEVYKLWEMIKPGTLGDRPKPMAIRLDSNNNVDNRCYRVTDANFAVGRRRCIGYSKDANDGTRCQSMLVDGGRCHPR